VADSEDEDLGESSAPDDGSDQQTEISLRRSHDIGVDVELRLSQTPSGDLANALRVLVIGKKLEADMEIHTL